MIEIRKTVVFAAWLDGLRDISGRARIQVRIEQLAMGNPGDAKPVGDIKTALRLARNL
jgi:putative addiction module killer protein